MAQENRPKGPLDEIMSLPGASTYELTELQYNDKPQFPFYGYVYGDDGFHDGKRYLQNEDDLVMLLARYVSDSPEIRITDTGDMMVCHIEKGKMIYPENGEFLGITLNEKHT